MKTIYSTRDAKILQDSQTGALRFDYRHGAFRCSYSLWSEVGEIAKPLFWPFWDSVGLPRNPICELESVDHGAAKPYFSNKLPSHISLK